MIKNEIGTILIGYEEFTVRLHWHDVKSSVRAPLLKKIQALIDKILKENPLLKIKNFSRISKDGILLKSGKVYPLKDSKWSEVAQTLIGKQQKKITLPDPFLADQPAPDVVREGKASAKFSFQKETHPMDRFRSVSRPSPKEVDTYQAVLDETKQVVGKKFDLSKRLSRDTMLGVRMGMAPRKNYEMQVTLQGKMRDFFGRDSFVSREVLAKNSPIVDGAVTSSFNRMADTVQLLRKVEAETGESEYYTGRVDTLAKAKEEVSFLFLAEWELYKNLKTRPLAKGISIDPVTKQIQFQFAVQSLLSMAAHIPKAKNERKMFLKEKESYKSLVKKGPLRIAGLNVHLRPIPIAANQFNFMNSLEAFLPDCLSGKRDADKATEEADARLIQLASEHPSSKMIQDTIAQLKNKNLKSWELILNRAFLCHLLRIPLIVHCKSSVDRTSVAGAMITAMHQWIRSGKEIPHAIQEIVREKVDDFEPFKELFALALYKGQKIAEFSRAAPWFKFEHGRWQHPALQDLLPADYLEKVRSSNIFPSYEIKKGGAHPLLKPKAIASK